MVIYYLAKLLQAAGLAVILIDYIRHFPGLMSRQVLTVAIIIFIIGWGLERVKRRI